MQISRKQLATFLATIFVVNLVVMGGGAWLSYANEPEIPDTIVGPDDETVATSDDVQSGKAVFQENGLMNQGSILGHGSYYDTDYTADALESKTEYMREYYAQERHGQNYTALNASVQAGIDQEVRQELQSSRYQPDRVEYSDAEVYAHQQVREEYVERYYEGDRERGIPEGQVPSAEEAEEFADFALWTAWISHTDRPDSEASFTNDWPYSPAAGNDAGGPVMTWSVIAMVLLVGGAGSRSGSTSPSRFPNPTRPAFRSRIRAKST